MEISHLPFQMWSLPCPTMLTAKGELAGMLVWISSMNSLVHSWAGPVGALAGDWREGGKWGHPRLVVSFDGRSLVLPKWSILSLWVLVTSLFPSSYPMYRILCYSLSTINCKQILLKLSYFLLGLLLMQPITFLSCNILAFYSQEYDSFTKGVRTVSSLCSGIVLAPW